jgi:hypothetical protein
VSSGQQILIQLDPVPAVERSRMATDLVAWFVERGVIAPTTASPVDRDHFAYSDWEPGPQWRSVVDYDPELRFSESPYFGVSISPDREMYSAGGNSESPTCVRCRTELDTGDSFGALIDEWLESGEPEVKCPKCGWSARLGDWPTGFPPGLVGAPTVVFEGWLQLREDFIADVFDRMGGGRCRYFVARI